MRRLVHLPELAARSPRVSVWWVAVGDAVYAGDRLVEVLVDGAIVDVTAPVSGTLAARHVFVDEPVAPGQLVAEIDEDVSQENH